MVRKGKGAVPAGAMKARKPAALIVAEVHIKELRSDMKELKKLVWAAVGGIITSLLMACGTLALQLLNKGH